LPSFLHDALPIFRLGVSLGPGWNVALLIDPRVRLRRMPTSVGNVLLARHWRGRGLRNALIDTGGNIGSMIILRLVSGDSDGRGIGILGSTCSRLRGCWLVSVLSGRVAVIFQFQELHEQVIL